MRHLRERRHAEIAFEVGCDVLHHAQDAGVGAPAERVLGVEPQQRRFEGVHGEELGLQQRPYAGARGRRSSAAIRRCTSSGLWMYPIVPARIGQSSSGSHSARGWKWAKASVHSWSAVP